MAINEQNEFLFLPINHRTLWEEGLLQDVVLCGEVGIALRTTNRYVPDYTIGRKELPLGINITDAAVGPCQTMYVLDATARTVYRYDHIESRYEQFVCLKGYCSEPTAIAYTYGGIIVADVSGQNRLLHFADLNGQLTWCVGEAEDSDGNPFGTGRNFKPSQLAIDSEWRIYVLDSARCRVIQFDAHGRYLAEIGAAELNGKQPSALTVSPLGTLYVLELQEQKVLEFMNGAFTSSFNVPLQSPSGLAFDSSDFLYMGENRKLIGGKEDRFLHPFDKQRVLQEVLSVYQGSVDKIMIDANDRMYIVNKETSQITVLRLETVLFKQPGSPLATGIYYSKTLDKTESRKPWHKLVIEAELPSNTQIEVSYLASDQLLSDIDQEIGWSPPQINPKQMLILDRKEQYLWVKLTLIGSDTQSPLIRSIQAVFPRTSYLRYLPVVYQEDDNSRDLLERYLSIFESFMNATERRIDTIARWFDADSVTGDYLRWLATWLEIAYDQNWSEDKLRSLIHAIPELYGKRGTRDGLEEMIQLFTGARPIIVEQFQLQCVKGTQNKLLLERLFGKDPYSFCMLMKPEQIHTEREYITVQRIVDTEKPAHTSGGVIQLQPWICLDLHTYVGINTNLTEPDSRMGSGVIQRDTVLLNDSPFGQVGSSKLISAFTVLT